MLRRAFLMEVQPGKIADYEKSHNPIWPELEKILKSHGVHNYSIFHHPATNIMFGYLEIEDEQRFNSIADYPCAQRWWVEMKRYLVCAHPGDPKAKEEPMREVFHLD